MKRIWKIMLILLLVAATAGATFLGTMAWVNGQQQQAQMDMSSVEYKMNKLQELIGDYFIDDYDLAELEAAAADGAAAYMVEATGDRWSYYISADDMQAYTEQMNNAYVGIGVTILETEGGVEIVSVTEGSPAEEAGIQVGDICTAVEGQATADLGIEGTKAVVRGEEGTFVSMTFLRGTEILDLSVERRSIVTPVAEWEMLENNIALIAIYNFDYHCAEQTFACMDEALAQGAEAFLFDVRFNGGGLKDELVKVLDYLLPEGVLFRSVDYDGTEEVDYSDSACVEMPMAVLVNLDSYSAAEFFAAALQEYGWATVVGEKTYGKGNFQTGFELSDGSLLNISIGKYYTPNGVSLTGVGITPDIACDLSEEDYADLYYGLLEREDDVQLQMALDAIKQKIS